MKFLLLVLFYAPCSDKSPCDPIATHSIYFADLGDCKKAASFYTSMKYPDYRADTKVTCMAIKGE